MHLDERRIEHIKKWLEIALEDLRVAEFTFKMESSIPFRMIGFHSQQAAEKFIKALLLFYNVDFPYTHDLMKLIELIPGHSSIQNELIPIVKLTDYAVNRRYPDFYQKLTESEAIESLELAKFCQKVIMERFVNEGFEL
ncbi:MAG: HEPN domain-containing protein [Ignavibacteria bacterium]|jgi:HEPN domain-containing protein|nr:HEPN domain-containing protein [Ignavibacteria bacterium]